MTVDLDISDLKSLLLGKDLNIGQCEYLEQEGVMKYDYFYGNPDWVMEIVEKLSEQQIWILYQTLKDME